MRRQYRFICAVAGGMFLTRRPKVGPWPAYSNDVRDALKFCSEDAATEWLTENGSPRVWLEQHHQTLDHRT
jgi:hypothetical protein